MTALDAGGIEVTLFDDVIVALDWMYSNGVGGIKVVVREEDYDAAADILDFPAEEIPEAPEDVEDAERAEPESPGSPLCPSCGLATIATLPKLRVFVCLAVLIGAVGMVAKQLDLAAVAIAVVAVAVAVTPPHRCTSCGEKFSAEQQDRPAIDESPLPQDLIDEPCPHCGSTEIHRLYHRRLKALTMFQLFTVLVVPLSLFPRRVCDNCGRKSY